MRIAICTDIYLPQLSGVADSLQILAQELKSRGHIVRIYAPQIVGATPDPEIVRLPAYALRGSGGGLVVVLPLGAMKDITEFRPDVIHTNTSSSAGFFAAHAAKKLRVPLIGTDHTLPADYLHYAKLDYAPFRYLVRKLASWYYNHCVFVTAPSQNMLDELVQYGMHKPMCVISNHIPTDLFRPLPEKESLKKKYGITKRAVLIFGRIAIEKNLVFALAVFSDVAKELDVELVFIGDGPHKQTLHSHAEDLDILDRTHFLGVLRGEELVEAINACEVFLITSTSESQSMTTLQSMACGLPVVAVNAGGIPEYVHSGVSGYVVARGDRSEFCKKVVELLSDTKRRSQFGAEGRKSVARYSPQKITDQFEEIFVREITRYHGPQS